MKKKQYEKLVLDATTLSTKAKLLEEQIVITIENAENTIAATDEKLTGIGLSIEKMKKHAAIESAQTEFAITATTTKRLLHAIEKDLASSVETPSKNHNKQINTLREALQKIIGQKESLVDDGEFDLSHVQTLLDGTQQMLDDNAAKLQELLKNLMATQAVADKCRQEHSMLMLDDELEDATQSTTKLATRVSHIADCLANSPGLAKKHKEFAPLLRAFNTLNLQAQQLARTTETDASPAAPANSGVAASSDKSEAKHSPRVSP